MTRTLRLSGQINLSATLGSQVTTTVSYVGVDDGDVTPQDLGGDMHLIVRDAGNAILHDQIFALEEDALTPHDSDLHHGAAHRPDHGVNPVSLFHLRVPFPVNATKAEIVHDNVVLWSKTVSANAPTVNVTAPNGGTFNAASPINVTWTANDTRWRCAAIRPRLLGGQRRERGCTINPFITGNSLAWTPGFVPASNTARVRIRASDGFNTAFATSASFVLTAQAPKAIILSPETARLLPKVK